MPPCRVCGRALDDFGTCVCVAFPTAPPAPVAWSFVTKPEVNALRSALHALRGAEVTHGVRSWPPVDVKGYFSTASVLANVVEELLVELPRRRPREDQASADVALFLGGARSRGDDEA